MLWGLGVEFDNKGLAGLESQLDSASILTARARLSLVLASFKAWACAGSGWSSQADSWKACPDILRHPLLAAVSLQGIRCPDPRAALPPAPAPARSYEEQKRAIEDCLLLVGARGSAAAKRDRCCLP